MKYLKTLFILFLMTKVVGCKNKASIEEKAINEYYKCLENNFELIESDFEQIIKMQEKFLLDTGFLNDTSTNSYLNFLDNVTEEKIKVYDIKQRKINNGIRVWNKPFCDCLPDLNSSDTLLFSELDTSSFEYYILDYLNNSTCYNEPSAVLTTHILLEKIDDLEINRRHKNMLIYLTLGRFLMKNEEIEKIYEDDFIEPDYINLK